MARRDEVAALADRLLQVGEFRDSCPNGLQVFGREEIRLLATGTSASLELFERARAAGADAILVHHGLFWDRDPREIRPHLGDRLRSLLEPRINLFAYHLPLDAHQELGNSARLADLVGLGERDFAFGHYNGMCFGVVGSLRAPLCLWELCALFGAGLGASPIAFGCGPEPIRRVGIVAGGAGDQALLIEAQSVGCDVYVTGSLSESAPALARELKLSIVGLGHHNSEKLGVRALGDRLGAELGFEVVHLEVQNPI